MNMAFSDSRTFDTGEGTLALRPLAWGELCARLTAAQDLRRLQAVGAARGMAGEDTLAGSFHGGAAQMLEHHGGQSDNRQQGQNDEAQDLVNLTSSINRKGSEGKHVDSRETPLIERSMRQADENCHD